MVKIEGENGIRFNLLIEAVQEKFEFKTKKQAQNALMDALFQEQTIATIESQICRGGVKLNLEKVLDVTAKKFNITDYPSALTKTAQVLVESHVLDAIDKAFNIIRCLPTKRD